MSEINSVNFEEYASDLIEEWLNLMSQKEYDKANDLCFNFIDNYSLILNKRLFGQNEKNYNIILIILILFKGLQDYIQLCQMTQDRDWYKDSKTVECVWIVLCDSTERIDFASNYCNSEIIERVVIDIKGLEKFFRDSFGDGMYFSPGIIADKSLCNICQKDARACSHIAGRLYDGRICYYQQVNPQIDHIALVKVPKDPRCRIWSWQVKDNDQGEGIKIDKACVFTTFSIDDFIHKC